MSDYWQFPKDEDGIDADSGAPADSVPSSVGGRAAAGPSDSRAEDFQASTPPPPPYSPPSPPPWSDAIHRAPSPRLYRSRNHRLLGGVSGGIAQHLGVDPLLIRFATVLVLMSGIGIFAYLAAWILMPLEPVVGAPASRRAQRQQANAGSRSSSLDQVKSALAIGVVAILLGITFDSFSFVALWLIGGGIWLLSQHPKPVLAQAQQAIGQALDTPQEHKVPLSPQDQQRWRRQYEWEAERYGWPDIGDPPAEVRVQAPPRPRQTITRLVLALLLLLLALGTAASAGDWWDVRMSRMLGIALVTVGGGVVLGAVFRNRSRGLIPLGLFLAVALIPTSVATNGAGGLDAFGGGVGVRAVAPTTVTMLQPSYELAVGELTIDLSQLDFDGASRTVDVSVAAGELQVLLPANLGGSVSVETSVGEVSVELHGAGAEQRLYEGLNIDTGELLLSGSNGELFLNIKASVGDIEVRQVGS